MTTGLSLDDAARVGMAVAIYARENPESMAITSSYGDRTYGELNAAANRLIRALRAAGLEDGDSVAMVSKNRAEFCEVLMAAYRGGLRFTPVNFHLRGEEIGYVVDNCEAKVFIADASLGEPPVEALEHAPAAKIRLVVGGSLEGFEDYAAFISKHEPGDICDPVLGTQMLYTSGTTGRPKGVHRDVREAYMPSNEGPMGYSPGKDAALCTGPGYHSAPLMIDIMPALVSGANLVMMDRWDAEESLRLIAKHRVTHSHMVATMFHRMLQLPKEVRERYDVSHLKFVIHGAAPCPVHTKQAMIEWFGPVIWEYYAATEGGGGFFVGSEEWLTKPGTVGKPGPDFDNKILDEEGNELPQGEVGYIYMRAPAEGRFEYYKDAEKTASSYWGDYFTLGDMGYFDEDGYLFLTGRTADLIISGGVNIYPQEVDNELMKHAAVLDACTVGVPNDEWGEEVKSVVQLNEGHTPSEELSAELITFAREHLASFKCPRSIDYVAELPRSAAGKIQRRVVREPYWAGREKQI